MTTATPRTSTVRQWAVSVIKRRVKKRILLTQLALIHQRYSYDRLQL